MIKPISISLSPNVEKDDVWLAFKLIFQPWRWKWGKEISELENGIKNYLGTSFTISFNSGRSALLAILKSLELQKGDEVLLQAFTCNAAVNPIIWAGLKPVFVDCEERTFNIDITDLERKITPKSRAIIVQHTFGLPAEISKILKICRQNHLFLIEDCAHSLGADYKGKKVGFYGDAAFFSFSRDKVISSVYGGMVSVDDEKLAEKIVDYRGYCPLPSSFKLQPTPKIDYPSNFWIFQQLLHPVLMNFLILPTYRFFGKYLLVALQKFNILSKAVHWKEKKGLRPGYFPKRLPNALALLAICQLKKIERFNSHRMKIAGIYYNELEKSDFVLPVAAGQIFLRYTIKHPDAHKIIKKAWKNNILIGDWYTVPVAPRDTDLDKMQYIKGSCPKAEKLANETLNLPTHINISEDDAQKIVVFLRNYESYSGK